MMDKLQTSKGVINIRVAVPDDAVLLRAIRLEALTNYPQAYATDYDSAAKESIESWSKYIKNYEMPQKGVIYIASFEDQLVGMLGLIRGNWPKTQHLGTIWGVYIKEDWRRLHIGQTLVQKCISWAQSQNMVNLKLSVLTSNTKAICCYTNCGFNIYGIDPKAIFYDDLFYDEFLMVKQIL